MEKPFRVKRKCVAFSTQMAPCGFISWQYVSENYKQYIQENAI